MRFHQLEDLLDDLLARIPWRWILWPLAGVVLVGGAGARLGWWQ